MKIERLPQIQNHTKTRKVNAKSDHDMHFPKSNGIPNYKTQPGTEKIAPKHKQIRIPTPSPQKVQAKLKIQKQSKYQRPNIRSTRSNQTRSHLSFSCSHLIKITSRT
jgi:hypothetical protein